MITNLNQLYKLMKLYNKTWEALNYAEQDNKCDNTISVKIGSALHEIHDQIDAWIDWKNQKYTDEYRVECIRDDILTDNLYSWGGAVDGKIKYELKDMRYRKLCVLRKTEEFKKWCMEEHDFDDLYVPCEYKVIIDKKLI